MYKVQLTKNNNQIKLTLSCSKKNIRVWYGNIAQRIFNTISTKYRLTKDGIIYLKKKQIHALFTEITCLYQTILFQYKIDTDLIKNNIPRICFNIAESLLLQIRINTLHPSYEDLQAFFLDEFKDFDLILFNQTINLLIEKNLIQSIITDDGQQFFDKNIELHDHIYFKKHKKLVDCTKEIADFFSMTKHINKSKQTCAKIFYFNKELNLGLS